MTRPAYSRSMHATRLTFAVNDVPAMVLFMNEVFGCGLRPLDADAPSSFHLGSFCDHELLLCPNDIAGVRAEQNRQQWRLAVHELDQTIDAVRDAGGTVVADEGTGDSRVVGIRDPDGNTYELVAARA